MADYPYTTVPGKIKNVLAKVRDVGVPAKANTNWLKTIGFTSSNDKSLLSVIKYIGLTDGQSTPTTTWKSYRGVDHKKVLAEAVRAGYADLFNVYEDANSRPLADIENVFKTSSSAGSQAISKTVSTFKALCDEADFGDVNTTAASTISANNLHVPIVSTLSNENLPSHHQKAGGPSLHIDIQIHIAPESSLEQIDQIFESMAKHLYTKS
ncbi:DUF5343 domain-containing protein [Rhizobium sp.]